MSLLTPLDEERANGRPQGEGLTIRISSGTGVGRTRLSAFDSALMTAGVGDFNLLRLSSVIPPGSDVVEVAGAQQVPGEHGDRLYCVYAATFASTPHEQAWAGVAWSRRNDGSGEGLFVEHAGHSESAVLNDLRLTLADLSARRGGDFTPAGVQTSSAVCIDLPVCALVIATYGRSAWSSDGG